MAFVYKDNARAKKAFARSVPFIIATNKIEIFWNNLTKDVKALYNENLETFL